MKCILYGLFSLRLNMYLICFTPLPSTPTNNYPLHPNYLLITNKLPNCNNKYRIPMTNAHYSVEFIPDYDK